jgi:Na+-transporting NADH:ubiquinone oxidoreductase subunit C
MIARLPGMEQILAEAGVDSLEVRVVDLATGTFADDIDPATFDQRAAASDPELSIELPKDVDIANLGRRANDAPVYLIHSGDELALIVLPVYGAGYASTLYGYLALEGDANTVAGLTFYEQGDTPGLGARVQDPAWQALWPGKQIADENGEIQISIVRGEATGPYEVEGISGASRTSAGVGNLLRFWLGDDGFGPFLRRLKAGEIPQ